MNNRTAGDFWRLFHKLPADVQARARAAFQIFKDTPRHPSLRFKALAGHAGVHSVRIGLHYRAVARQHNDTLYWFWIGTHSDFDKEFS